MITTHKFFRVDKALYREDRNGVSLIAVHKWSTEGKGQLVRHLDGLRMDAVELSEFDAIELAVSLQKECGRPTCRIQAGHKLTQKVDS